jgi:hypothetical protein
MTADRRRWFRIGGSLADPTKIPKDPTHRFAFANGNAVETEKTLCGVQFKVWFGR